jgi:DNA polymerase III alpha subunit (gram-positive type)
MKTNDDLKLLDAVLADDDWNSCSTQIQQAGLTSLRARKKARARLEFGTHVGLSIFAAVVCVWTFVGRDNDIKREMVAISNASVAQSAPSPDSHYITEEQMLKMFPEGSCLVAEVNGEKQLVFLSDTDRDRD